MLKINCKLSLTLQSSALHKTATAVGFPPPLFFGFLRLIAVFNVLWLPLGSESKPGLFQCPLATEPIQKGLFSGWNEKKIFQNKKKKLELELVLS